MNDDEHKPKCRSCGALIIWADTEKGRRVPLDATPVPDGNMRLESRGLRSPVAIVITAGREAVCRAPCPRPVVTSCPPYNKPCPPECPRGMRYKSHFATCPQAQQHRKRH